MANRPYYATFVSFETSQPGFKPKRPSRGNNYRVGNEPGFTCPRCRDSFKLKFGVFGKFGSFGETSLHCLDCSEKPGFCNLNK